MSLFCRLQISIFDEPDLIDPASAQRMLEAFQTLSADHIPLCFLLNGDQIVAQSGQMPCALGPPRSHAGPAKIDELANGRLKNAMLTLMKELSETDACGEAIATTQVDDQFQLASKLIASSNEFPIRVFVLKQLNSPTASSEESDSSGDLKSKVRRLELALSGNAVGIWEGDVNREDWIEIRDIEAMLGYEPNALQNSRARLRDLIHPDDYQINERERGKHLKGNVNISEVRMKTAKGVYRWFRIVGEAAVDKDGKVISLAGTFTDIHDLKRTQLAFAEQLRRRDEFLAMLSHELRNPMAAITFASDFIQTTADLPNGLHPYFEIISRQIVQMSRLMDDLLDVSRITQNKIEIEKVFHDFNELVEQIVNSAKATFNDREQTFTCNLPAGPTIINGDSVRLKQAFTNLLDNASKYTERGGKVHLEFTTRDGIIIVQIRDNGRGIAENAFEDIFELFHQQTQPDQASATGGMGVGLFLVRHIIEAHNGNVVVASKGVGHGSEFTIELPLAEKVVSSIAAGQDVMFKDLKLAFVEDNSDTRNVMTHLLELRGIEVHQFENGETASELIPAICPDVALIDIGLPGKNGYEVANELRQAPSLKNTLLIALTGFGQDSDRDKARDAGFDDHVVKPIRVNSLCELIAENLKR